ncbi:site-specific integrase [Gordonia rubripertincta]|uniref:Site-specific integrase n=1 Tax=Gordonia rubripertincta TaxID=36822 RepID=A0AAW6R522_GORRU|nr:site-specific integrase [Gordonia rubripertincta]MDG6779581.1 site-specific integrase [Gordonia rubripertincta]NKY62887.1 site-specific integrase [Gordonia rubripertincta]
MATKTAAAKTTKRNVRSGVLDRWHSRKALPDGEKCGASCASKFSPTARHGKGLRWQARFVARDGREVGKGFATKGEAQRWLDEQMADVTRHEYVRADRSAMTVAEFAEDVWLPWLATRAASTAGGYLSRYNAHILPRWGDVALVDLDFEGISAWVGSLSSGRAATVTGDKGLSRSSVSECLVVLSGICTAAVKAGRLRRNPCRDVELPKANREAVERRVYLTSSQVFQLAAAMVGEDGDTENETLLLLLAEVGLRIGEAAGLQIGEIDFENRTAWIRLNAVEVSGRMVLGPPKSGKPRQVSLSAFITDRLRAVCAGRSSEAFVFQQGGSKAKGESKPLRRKNWATRKFAPAVIAAGFVDAEGDPLITPHDLRHTAAAEMVRRGMHVHQVQRQLGHSRASITLDVYSDLFAEDLSVIGESWDREYVKLMGGTGAPGGEVLVVTKSA